jgi:uncharacterized protein YbcV (DUF1398 family)
MNHEVAKECTHLSDEEKITFPDVVRRLTEAGIDSYYADLLAHTKTYYGSNTAYTVNCSFKSKKEVSDTFHSDGIRNAIRQSQSGQIQYQEFVNRAMSSGVFSYMVFIKGRKVIYFGKHGEQHVEEFPK